MWKLDLTELLSASKKEPTAKKTTKTKPTPKKEKQPKQEKQEKTPKLTERPALMQVVTAFKELAIGILTRFARHIRPDEFRLRVLVATDDAAKTAMEYGAVCAAAGAVRAAVEGLRRADPKRINVQVECDFLAEAYEFDAELCVSIRVWRLALIALFASRPLIEAIELLKAYRYYKKEEKQDGNTHEATD